MIWLYDNAIADDLSRSINPSAGACPIVKVMDSAEIISLVAQMREDRVEFPLICVVRHKDTPVDNDRCNFTRLHKGVQAVYDAETHMFYNEKVLPIKLEYDIIVLATNVIDMDEIVKELLFKYTSTYFITMELPYECKRKVRFGVAIDSNTEITRNTSTAEYLSEGKLYETVIPVRCEGAVLVSYTPTHLERPVFSNEIGVENPSENLKYK